MAPSDGFVLLRFFLGVVVASHAGEELVAESTQTLFVPSTVPTGWSRFIR